MLGGVVMVKSLSSLTGSGVRDFIWQRLSAYYLLIYLAVMICAVNCMASFSFAAWSALFAQHWVKGMTFVALISLIMHAWVGMWTIFTDYVPLKCLRSALMLLLLGETLYLMYWGIKILWG